MIFAGLASCGFKSVVPTANDGMWFSLIFHTNNVFTVGVMLEVHSLSSLELSNTMIISFARLDVPGSRVEM